MIEERWIVKTSNYEVPLEAEGWKLQSGEFLPVLNIRYECYGKLAEDASNAVLICPPLTADAHAAGFYEGEAKDAKPGWWDSLIGPGKALDTNRFFVICSNLLGGCAGTTGPSSINPKTARAFGSDFPTIRIEDMVSVQRELVKHLEIEKLYAVVGGSMGGLQVLRWAIDLPENVEKCICIAATSALSSQALGFEIISRELILNDPEFRGGDYYDGTGPSIGLAAARKIAHLTYLSADSMENKFGRKAKEKSSGKFRTGFEIESYLNYQGKKFVDRFDANSYLHITHAMDLFDLAQEFGSLEKAFCDVEADMCIVNLSSDWLFPPQESRRISAAIANLGKVVTNVELQSPYGHDAFLLEVENISDVIRSYLCADCPRPTSSETRAQRTVFQDDGDFDTVASLVSSGSRILDMGSGDGRLVESLWEQKGVTGIGIDRDFRSIIKSMHRNVPVLQLDLDLGLSLFDDNSFDYAILNRTLQQVQKPGALLKEILRVSRRSIIRFPNFGHWKARLHLFFRGNMPQTRGLPYEWYETPNIHLFTLDDIEKLCSDLGFVIEYVQPLTTSWTGKILVALGFRNLGASEVIIRVARQGMT